MITTKTIVLGALALIAVPSLAAAQISPPPPPSATEGPDRSGLTFELGLGVGFTSVTPDGAMGDQFTGVSGLNLGFGAWMSPKTAVTVRAAGTSFVADFEGTDVQVISGLLGVSAQQMVSEQIWFGAGLGIGVLDDNRHNTEAQSGLGLDFRAGCNFYQSRKNAFNAAVEVTPAFFDGGRVTGIGLQVGWQAL